MRSEPAVVERADLQALFDALAARGYRVIGPTVREGAIVYSEVKRVEKRLEVGSLDHGRL